MFKRFLAAMFAVACLGSAAFAADLGNRLPAAPTFMAARAPLFTWTGFYAGADIGAGFSQNTATFDGFGVLSKSNARATKAAFGIHAGYRYQLPNSVVFGVEFGFQNGGGGNFVDLPQGIQGSMNINWQMSGRAIVGWAFGAEKRTLLYVAAGPTYNVGNMSGGPTPFMGINFPEQRKRIAGVGWTLGAGFEHAFTDNLSGRLEGGYSTFQSAAAVLGPLYTKTSERVDIKGVYVRAGINYRFWTPVR